MTEFYDILNEHEMIIKENEELRNFIKLLTEKLNSFENSEDNLAIISDMPRLLQALVQSHKMNQNKSKQGFRYTDELIRRFSSFSKDMGGKQTYEFWSRNLPIPSLSTVATYNQKSSKPIVEGEFRFEELVKYLDDRGVGREVWLSEDGTRIKGQIQYEPTSNQLVGFVPPLDSNGLPVIGAFEATSAEVIKQHMSSESCSNYAYVMMAQPLTDIPAFCLCMFGTNNKFSSFQVEQRWKWLQRESVKFGITIVGFSSDGDPRLLAAMKRWTFGREIGRPFSVLPDWRSFFFAPMELNWNSSSFTSDQPDFTPSCIQDCVHTVGKLKNQLLKKRTDLNFLPMGKCVVSGTFLQILVEEQSKLDHGLSKSDLDSEDKMNFRVAQKLADERVLRGLDLIPGAEGTKTYLVILKSILDAFLDKTMDVSKRVYLVWKSVFFLRYWDFWLKEHNYKSCNFISANTYQCVEISAHALVNVIRRFRDLSMSHLFLPWLMSSQPCETYFRTARSCTTICSTIVNMTMLEFRQRSRKIARMMEMGHELDKDIIVPRHHKRITEAKDMTEQLKIQHLINDNELCKVISQAKTDALLMAKDLGMTWEEIPQVTPAFIVSMSNKCPDRSANDKEIEEECEDVVCEATETPETNETMPEEVAEDILQETEAQEKIDMNLSPKSIFVVYEENGKRTVMRKSTLVWRLTSKKFNLSSDRQARVKAAEETLQQSNEVCISHVTISENISLGDWAVFKNCSLQNSLYVGRILNFCYLSGTGKSREYSSCTVPTAPPAEIHPRGIGCLGEWYTVCFEGDGKLVKCYEPYKYHDISSYVCTLPRPTAANGAFSYPPDIVMDVKNILQHEDIPTSRNKNTSKKSSNDKTTQEKRKTFERLAAADPQSDSDEEPKSNEVRKRRSNGDDNQCNNQPKKRKSRTSGRIMFPESDSGSQSGSQDEGENNSSLLVNDAQPIASKPASPLNQRFAPLERPPTEGEFVLVEFPGKVSKYYVAKVLEEVDEEGDLQVSYLRRNSKAAYKFMVPAVPDLASVELIHVKMILPHPSCTGSTRQQSLYHFDTNFNGLSVN